MSRFIVSDFLGNYIRIANAVIVFGTEVVRSFTPLSVVKILLPSSCTTNNISLQQNGFIKDGNSEFQSFHILKKCGRCDMTFVFG